MAYRDEILALTGGQVTLVPQDTNGLPYLDGIIATAERNTAVYYRNTAVYCCGPGGMREVEQLCAEKLPPGALPVERFTATADVPGDDAEDGAFEVELRQSGITLTVPGRRVRAPYRP
jgi:ferredoxin-NADP reductase